MRAAVAPDAAPAPRAAAEVPLHPVALMHPDGEVRAEDAVGARAEFRRGAPRSGPRRGADLLRVAPSAAECRAPGWLDGVAARMERDLAEDGIAYVLPPPGWRGRLAARLRAAGFRVEAPVAHLSVRGAERFLVPLRPTDVGFLLGSVPAPRPLRRAARALAAAPGALRLAAETLPAVGFVARRPGGRPPFAWLREMGGADHRRVVVAGGWRGAGDSVLLHLLSAEGERVAVAKVGRAGARVDEADVLRRLGGAARDAGAAVPRVLGAGRVSGRRVALLAAVPGERAATALRGRPGRVAPLLGRLAAWLEAWNRATLRVEPLDPEALEREVLRPLALLAPLLPDGAAYAARVRSLCARLAGTPLPRVAAHGDLTMHNVLLDGAAPGVVDWEAARPDGWPLADLEYAAVDAAAAAGGYRDRTGAWAACFRGGGAWAPEVGRLRARAAEALEVPPAFAALCRHACWLHHAANEHVAAGPGSRPFLGVLRAVAEAG